ncbi:MAG: SpoIIIAH-like family protein [Acutalibacter sp.]|nr:SpoIIIAH-like family protein [Acutalibacter sp.]
MKFSKKAKKDTGKKILNGMGKKQLVLASMVLALGAAVYLNWQFAGVNKLPVEDSSSTVSELGAAQLVNNAYLETVSDNLKQPASSGASTLSEARLNRQNSRDEAMDMLDEVLENVDADSEAKKEAVEQASAIAQNILKETNVENLLQAKGYQETVAYLSGEKCNVVVAGELQAEDTLIIQEVVMDQTGLTADKITIIGTN